MNNPPVYNSAELSRVFSDSTSARRRFDNVDQENADQGSSMVEQQETEERPLPNYQYVKRECRFIQYCVKHASALPEYLWFAQCSIEGRCQNGPEIFHENSSAHDDYTYEETDRKIMHSLQGPGPHTCNAINEITKGEICSSCQHWGRIKSPIQLGYDKSDDPLKQVVAEYNKNHAVVMFGGKCLVIREEDDGDITFMTKTDFLNFNSNRTVSAYGPRGPKRIKSANYWFESEDRREYPMVKFSPNKEPGNYYNLYRGLAVNPVQGDWSLMKRHIFEVIASGDQRVFDYVIAWMARIVKDPGGHRPGVAIVLRGGQGTGKGVLVNNFGEIFGIHYAHIFNQDQLTGKFNSHLARSIFVFCDESVWAFDKTAEGVLKGLVTEPHIMMEPKGKDAVKIDNHVNLMIASNNSWVAPAGVDERRFFCLDVSDKYQQNTAYFTAIQEQMDNGGREAMLYDLLQMDISNVNLRDFPRTEALLDQVIYSLDSVGKYWFEILRDGCFNNEWDGHDHESEWPQVIPVQVVHEQYKKFCRDHDIRYPLRDSQFGKGLSEYCPGIVRVRRGNANGKRVWCYDLPDIVTCRNNFEKHVHNTINWEK